MKITFTILLLLSTSLLYGQGHLADTLVNTGDLKKEILDLRTEVTNIQVNLWKSEKRFKTGIAVATLGYSVTIAGGLMLGRKRDDLGKALLIAGGVTGITGTILMVDAFKFLGRASRKKSP
jgi:hypothetical protein